MICSGRLDCVAINRPPKCRREQWGGRDIGNINPHISKAVAAADLGKEGVCLGFREKLMASAVSDQSIEFRPKIKEQAVVPQTIAFFVLCSTERRGSVSGPTALHSSE